MRPLTTEQIGTLCTVARHAGAAIMDVYRGDFAVWEKTDASPLTEADLRADSIIRRELEAAFPGVFILSEESASTVSADTDPIFLVDPLDGTKEFLRRNGEFTVNIALVHQGRSVAGVVFAPALDELFWACVGHGAWKRADPSTVTSLKVAPYDGTQPLRIIGSRSHSAEAVANWLAGLNKPHTFVAAGSSLKFCLIAEGKADVYPRFGPTSQWDTAAAQCILEESGGIVVDTAAKPLVYGLNQPILNPHFFGIGDKSLGSLV
ncbi:MAG: 3'(2'),5'-bisphosphate nucleotidase CysQ [Dechloromonas sp.]|nr:3'(2'),5'-bisphosphate nucleotidase CysQ [Dechloromonas sp.]